MITIISIPNVIHRSLAKSAVPVETLSAVESELSALAFASALLPWVEMGSFTPLSLSGVVVASSLSGEIEVWELWTSLEVGEECDVAKARPSGPCAVGV